MTTKTTMLVNFFAGPGAGKSTAASQVFGLLKDAGVCAEIAPEFAKELTWEGRYAALRCQPYVLGEMLWRIQRLVDAGVEVVVCDSPLLLSNVYWADAPGSFRAFVRTLHGSMPTANFWVSRVKPYDPRGRQQSEDSARFLDDEIRRECVRSNVPLIDITGSHAGAAEAARQVLRFIGKGAQ